MISNETSKHRKVELVEKLYNGQTVKRLKIDTVYIVKIQRIHSAREKSAEHVITN
jgi:hypothetical protein